MRYSELRRLFNHDALKHKVKVAVMVAAHAKIAGTPTAGEQNWAVDVFERPESEGLKAFRAVLAANKDVTVEQATGASDAAIQTQVDAIVDSLVVAFNTVVS